eukprot:330903-Rhodomonas_salina.1
MAAVLRESWRVIQSVTTTEHLAELFFNELNIVAPHVIHLFKLPKKMQSIRLHSICELLIKFFECPDVFFARFKLLAIRHISYVRPPLPPRPLSPPRLSAYTLGRTNGEGWDLVVAFSTRRASRHDQAVRRSARDSDPEGCRGQTGPLARARMVRPLDARVHVRDAQSRNRIQPGRSRAGPGRRCKAEGGLGLCAAVRALDVAASRQDQRRGNLAAVLGDPGRP